ncbi:MAG TPA: efflux transporter outer membrane subunit [Steroidobacteraceae bacterium]|jgi:NodT family efflux transporter outer membrane factor (OMF) lipoprotein|nr:efflux transporter outer membrane subunit [Steroidobacteraceae bacterium]
MKTSIPLSVALGAMLYAVLAGCVSRGDWHATPAIAPQNLIANRTLANATVVAEAWPTDAWWTGYGDPQLDALIAESFEGSPSLEIAQARLRSAQSQATRAKAAREPTTTVDAQVTKQRFPENGLYPPPYAGSFVTQGQLALDFSYEIDFWGRNREALASARATVQAAEADKAAARLALAVAVARAYFQLNLSYAFLDVTQSNLAQQLSILDLTRQRVAAGLENTARVKQSEGQVALVRASVDATQANIDTSRNAIAALVGVGPDRGLDLQRPRLTAPANIVLPSTLPVDLLGRRPDVTAARWRVEAAARGVAASEAAFYPNVNLVAFAGLQAVGLSKLFDANDAVVGGGPAFSLPVFNRGELRGALEAQQAQYDLSVGQYNQSLIDAIHDVADVMTNWAAIDKVTADARVALEAAQNSYDLTRERYSAGLDNYLSVLSAENQVFLAQALIAEVQSRRLTTSTDLIRALGGGYKSTN